MNQAVEMVWAEAWGKVGVLLRKGRMGADVRERQAESGQGGRCLQCLSDFVNFLGGHDPVASGGQVRKVGR